MSAPSHRSISAGVVSMTGMALGWIGATTALASVVRKPESPAPSAALADLTPSLLPARTVVDVAVNVVPAAAMVAVIIRAAKRTPRRGHHGASRTADYGSDRATDHSSANSAGSCPGRLDWGGAAGQSQGRQRHQGELVHGGTLETPSGAIHASAGSSVALK